MIYSQIVILIISLIPLQHLPLLKISSSSSSSSLSLSSSSSFLPTPPPPPLSSSSSSSSSLSSLTSMSSNLHHQQYRSSTTISLKIKCNIHPIISETNTILSMSELIRFYTEYSLPRQNKVKMAFYNQNKNNS